VTTQEFCEKNPNRGQWPKMPWRGWVIWEECSRSAHRRIQ